MEKWLCSIIELYDQFRIVYAEYAVKFLLIVTRIVRSYAQTFPGINGVFQFKGNKSDIDFDKASCIDGAEILIVLVKSLRPRSILIHIPAHGMFQEIFPV